VSQSNTQAADGPPLAGRPGSARYCDDPDNCGYADCPTAFCDRDPRFKIRPDGSRYVEGESPNAVRSTTEAES
jgi:hypothetical protein